MPELFTNLSAFAINEQIKQELKKDHIDNAKTAELLSYFVKFENQLQKDAIKKILSKKLRQLANSFKDDPLDLNKTSKLVELLAFAEMFKLPVDISCAQNTVFKVYKALPEHIRQNQLLKVLCAKLNFNLD